MKKSFLCAVLALVGLAGFGQSKEKAVKKEDNTLLWRISGKELSRPSYLFGTMHMLCADDIVLSDSLKKAIRDADDVYLELDMDNMFEMMAALTKMKMRGDTTLRDLLTETEYNKVKAYFSEKSKLLPFSVLERYKPLLAASLLMEQQATECGSFISMEQLIMREADDNKVEIRGLESMAYQMSIFDSIPYGLQAKQLVEMIGGDKKKDDGNSIKALTKAYRSQELEKMAEMTRQDESLAGFTEILLDRRNQNWVKKMQTLLPGKSFVFAVGAGHLPGKEGVINLLRKAGYKVEPVQNEMVKKPKEAQG